MTDFWLRQNDTSPAIKATLQDEDGTDVDLTNATQVRFHMRNYSDDTLVVDAAASIVDAATGQVKYTWKAADTATAGTFKGEFQVTYSGGVVETYPNYTYIDIKITEELS